LNEETTLGEAAHNPRSPQYTGPLPDVALNARISLRVVPNAAFLKHVEELRAAGVDGPVAMTDADKDVVAFVVGQWAIPTRLSNEWPQSELPFHELARMPLTDFKKQHKANFAAAGMQAQANTIVIEETEPVV